MTWVLVLALAATVFAILARVLKVPRAGWELAGAALLLGVAGYALQGSPGQAGAPKPPVETRDTANAALVAQRQAMGDAFGEGRSWLIIADGLSRQGQFSAAAQVLRSGLAQTPRDADLWVALGNALVGHSDGMISPAAQLAFQRAADVSPAHPGPPFFMGLALAQSGRLAEARVLWAELLERAPEGADYRADLEARLARIDAMIGEAPPSDAPGAAGPGGGEPAAEPRR